MVKYVRTLPGRPYVKPCELTQGFVPGGIFQMYLFYSTLMINVVSNFSEG